MQHNKYCNRDTFGKVADGIEKEVRFICLRQHLQSDRYEAQTLKIYGITKCISFLHSTGQAQTTDAEIRRCQKIWASTSIHCIKGLHIFVGSS